MYLPTHKIHFPIKKSLRLFQIYVKLQKSCAQPIYSFPDFGGFSIFERFLARNPYE